MQSSWIVQFSPVSQSKLDKIISLRNKLVFTGSSSATTPLTQTADYLIRSSLSEDSLSFYRKIFVSHRRFIQTHIGYNASSSSAFFLLLYIIECMLCDMFHDNCKAVLYTDFDYGKFYFNVYTTDSRRVLHVPVHREYLVLEGICSHILYIEYRSIRVCIALIFVFWVCFGLRDCLLRFQIASSQDKLHQ